MGRSPHGERGLKFAAACVLRVIVCRSPHGERGLKLCHHGKADAVDQSLSSRRAWIEMNLAKTADQQLVKSLSSRRAWIEMTCGGLAPSLVMSRSPHGERGLKYETKSTHPTITWSLSSRRAWIEIAGSGPCRRAGRAVALLTESVD